MLVPCRQDLAVVSALPPPRGGGRRVALTPSSSGGVGAYSRYNRCRPVPRRAAVGVQQIGMFV